MEAEKSKPSSRARSKAFPGKKKKKNAQRPWQSKKYPYPNQSETPTTEEGKKKGGKCKTLAGRTLGVEKSLADLAEEKGPGRALVKSGYCREWGKKQ